MKINVCLCVKVSSYIGFIKDLWMTFISDGNYEKMLYLTDETIIPQTLNLPQN